jgi:MFS family permease
VPAATLFLWAEARGQNPLVPLRLFEDRNFTGSNALTIILYGGLSGALFLLPFVLINVHHYTPTVAGLAFVPFSVILGIGSRFAGGLASRTGPRLPLIGGPLVTSAGFAVLGLSGGNPSYWAGFFPGLALIGVGMTLVIPALTTTVFDSAPDADSGATSGINNAAARTGGLLAVAALGIAFGRSDLSSMASTDLAQAYRTVMLWATIAGVASAACAAVTISSTKKGSNAVVS